MFKSIAPIYRLVNNHYSNYDTHGKEYVPKLQEIKWGKNHFSFFSIKHSEESTNKTPLSVYVKGITPYICGLWFWVF